MGFRFRISGFVFRVSGFGFRVSGFGFRVSGFGVGASGFGFRVSGFGFRISGFGFRVSGFGFRVSGFGFRVSGFGLHLFRWQQRLGQTPNPPGTNRETPAIPPGRVFIKNTFFWKFRNESFQKKGAVWPWMESPFVQSLFALIWLWALSLVIRAHNL